MKIKVIISILAACSLVSVAEAKQVSSSAVSPAISIDRPGVDHPTSDFAHYSFRLDAGSQLKSGPQASMASSDEYWFQATGRELNQGIAINSTQAGALIRVTQGKSGKGQAMAPELDTSLLKLNSKQNPKQSAVGQMISKNQLAQTGVFDNTVAIKTASNIGGGALVLKSSQGLNADDTYMISVKEKNSPYRLQLKLDAQSYGESKRVQAVTNLLDDSNIIVPNSLKATLIAPDGQKSPVNFTTDKQGKVSLNLMHPKNAIAPIKGLYEVLVEAKGEANGLVVQRNAKLALAFTNDTARLAKASLDVQAGHANIAITVQQQSRYEVRGVLYGTNHNGELVPVMETHAAQTLKPGANKLRLPFNVKILKQAQVSAPFELQNVRLFDQGQLGLIDTLANKLVAY